MPHCRPTKNIKVQITIAEPMISTPAWRSVSPKNVITRPLKMSIDDLGAELDDAAERVEPLLNLVAYRRGAHAACSAYLICVISGWVASSVWVKT